MVKKMKKKTVILWVLVSVLLSACVYLSFPKDKKNQTEEQNNEILVDGSEEISSDLDLEAIVDAYFASRPVRDVPLEADFSSFLVGTFAKSQRDFKRTAQAYSSVLEKDAENKEIKDVLYQYYVLAGDVDVAYPYAQMSLEQRPEEALLPNLVVLSEMAKKGDFKQVLNISENLKAGKNSFLSHLLTSWAYAGINDKNKAFSSLEKVQQEQNLRAAYLLHKAMLFDYFKDADSAALMYDELLMRNEAKNVRVLLLLKEFESRTHALKNKKAFVLKYASMQEESFISKEMLSSPGDGGVVSSASEGISWVFFDMASAMSQINDLELALFFARLAQYLNPQNTVIKLFIGEILETMNLTEQANLFYQEVTPNQNIFLSVQMRSIMNMIKSQKTQQAIANLNALIKAFPNGALLHMTLGDAYREEKNFEKALLAYQNASKLVNHQDKQSAILFFYQGLCFEGLGKLEQAIEFFEKALSLDSQNPIYLNYTGYTWLELGKNISHAHFLIEKAVAQLPNDGSVLDSLGWSYFLMQNYDEALKILEKAVSLQAGNSVLNSHLGDVYWKLGRYREARFQWSHALTLKEASTERLKEQLAEKIKKGLIEKNVATKE